MTGSTADIIAIVIVAVIFLAFWLFMVNYSDSHPGWRGQAGTGAGAPRGVESSVSAPEAVPGAREGAVGAPPAGSVPAQREDTAPAPREGTVPAPRGETEPAPGEARRG